MGGDEKEYAKRAIEARERALRVGDATHKAEWLRIAESWEKLARAVANPSPVTNPSPPRK